MVRQKRAYPRLSVYKHSIRSPLELLGRNEKALTFAFGYTLYKCPKLLFKLLSHIGYKRRDKVSKLIDQCTIRLEQTDDFGRTDVEIRLSKTLYLILEGKRGRSYPALNQLDRYLKRLKSDDSCDKKLWILADREDIEQIIHNYQQRRKAFREGMVELSSFTWEEIADVCSSLLDDGALGTNEKIWLKRFLRFVKWERHWTMSIRDLENPLRDRGLQLISEIKKLRDENHWLLTRQPKAGLFGGREPWTAFASHTNERLVFGILADKKRTDWYIWFSLPRTLQELDIRLAPPLMDESKWDPEAKEYWVQVDNPRKDVQSLKPLFQAAYHLVKMS